MSDFTPSGHAAQVRAYPRAKMFFQFVDGHFVPAISAGEGTVDIDTAAAQANSSPIMLERAWLAAFPWAKPTLDMVEDQAGYIDRLEKLAVELIECAKLARTEYTLISLGGMDEAQQAGRRLSREMQRVSRDILIFLMPPEVDYIGPEARTTAGGEA